jgi:hypothetical protein
MLETLEKNWHKKQYLRAVKGVANDKEMWVGWQDGALRQK